MPREDKSLKMSMPAAKTVHGIKIEKVPVGRYLTVMKEMEDLPGRLYAACFPDMPAGELLTVLSNADKDALLSLANRVMAHAPEALLDVFCRILEVDQEAVRNTVTPAELLDVFIAFWEVNDLGPFFGNVWGLLKKRLPTRTTGFKSGSPLRKA